jgi:hypothetical protein
VNGAGDGKKTACLMSARSLLDGRPFGDGHPSNVLRRIGIRINDGPWWESNEERTSLLLSLALDERLCASKCDASFAAEVKRGKLAAAWALSFAAPMALDCAADALRKRWPDSAALLSGHADKLRREPTRENAIAARYDARKARHAAAAYAADAYAADAAYADDDAAKADDDAAKAKQRKREIRDSLMVLFGQLLDVRAEAA